jgi:hypothetical protein
VRLILNPDRVRAALDEPLNPDGQLDEPRARAVARQLDELRRLTRVANVLRGRVAA